METPQSNEKINTINEMTDLTDERNANRINGPIASRRMRRYPSLPS